jgi:hypothetical protein
VTAQYDLDAMLKKHLPGSAVRIADARYHRDDRESGSIALLIKDEIGLPYGTYFVDTRLSE